MKWNSNESSGARECRKSLLWYLVSSFWDFVDRSCSYMLCCRRDEAYTNSNHAKHFFLLAVNGHNPSYSLAAKPCNTTGLVFSAIVQRLVWSLFNFTSNIQTGHSHIQQISLFVYWWIMPVNFLPGSPVSVHPRVTRTHGNSNRAGQAACTSAVSQQPKSW